MVVCVVDSLLLNLRCNVIILDGVCLRAGDRSVYFQCSGTEVLLQMSFFEHFGRLFLQESYFIKLALCNSQLTFCQ